MVLAEAGLYLIHFLHSFSLLFSTGKDASEAFEDVGHSDEARALLSGMYVGDFEQGGVSYRRLSTQPSVDHSRFEGP